METFSELEDLKIKMNEIIEKNQQLMKKLEDSEQKQVCLFISLSSFYY